MAHGMMAQLQIQTAGGYLASGHTSGTEGLNRTTGGKKVSLQLAMQLMLLLSQKKKKKKEKAKKISRNARLTKQRKKAVQEQNRALHQISNLPQMQDPRPSWVAASRAANQLDYIRTQRSHAKRKAHNDYVASAKACGSTAKAKAKPKA